MEMYLVYGGELINFNKTDLKPETVHVIGLFQTRTQARDQWKANAQRTVDNAHLRYFILPITI